MTLTDEGQRRICTALMKAIAAELAPSLIYGVQGYELAAIALVAAANMSGALCGKELTITNVATCLVVRAGDEGARKAVEEAVCVGERRESDALNTGATLLFGNQLERPKA